MAQRRAVFPCSHWPALLGLWGHSMNWYPRYYGDYARDTAHLSLAEHGAYNVLLDHYYATGPLPDDMNMLMRICRAFDDHEKEAVKSVASKFFPLNGDGLRRNKRADEEIKRRESISNVRAVAGAKGAQSKWQGKDDGNCYGKSHGKLIASAATVTVTGTGIDTGTVTEQNIHAQFNAPTLEEVVNHGTSGAGIPESVCREFWQHYETQGWKLGSGLPMVKWQSGLVKWATKQRAMAIEGKPAQDKAQKKAMTKASFERTRDEVRKRIERAMADLDDTIPADMRKQHIAAACKKARDAYGKDNTFAGLDAVETGIHLALGGR
jgi:uncharacterized protein YdaU (DUF1376 family)